MGYPCRTAAIPAAATAGCRPFNQSASCVTRLREDEVHRGELAGRDAVEGDAVTLLLPLCAMVEAPLAKVAAASGLRARAGQWSSSQSSCGEVCAAAPASAAAPPSPTSAELAA